MRSALSCLFFSLSVFVSGCRADDPESAEDEDLQAAAQPTAGKCYSFLGNSHCELGAATIAVNRGLSVTGLRVAGRDGVAINLPDITSFTPSGIYNPGSATSTMIASSLSDGVVTSTAKLATTSRGTTFTATFTGNGQASTYTIVLSRNGQVLTSIPSIPSGQPGPASLPPCWRCEWTMMEPIGFTIAPVPSIASAAGACNWIQRFDPARPAPVVLASGQTLTVDRIELREDVSASGSYPYTSFDRIDYTADSGTFGITAEATH